MQPNGKEKAPSPPQEDIVQKSIGVFGRWHIFVCLIIFLVKFPVAWHQLSIVFLAPLVEFSCVNNSTEKCSSNCTNYIYDTSVFSTTIVTEWDLVCDKSYLANFAQTVTMLGILFGNMIFGYLSDKFGRRNPLVWAVILQAVSGLAAALSPWFPLFLLMRFLAALATGGTMVTSFVLVMEILGTEWRTVIGVLYQIPFNLGHLLMPLISYYVRDWRYFQAIISAPSLALIVYYWILPESPRWQLATGNKEGAVATMRRAAKANNLPTDEIERDVALYLELKATKDPCPAKGNIFDLVRTPTLRRYTIAIGFNWLVCGLCFFGVSQYIGRLGGDVFVNVAISAIIQVPSTVFACYATKAWGRKRTLVVADVMAGVAILMIGVVPAEPAWTTTLLSSVGMFGLALSFPTVYIYSGELFPTVVRNVGVGASSMCARIGSMASPFVAALGAEHAWAPPLVFGAVPLVGAALCLMLPETLDCPLPDTVAEAERYDGKKKGVAAEGTEMS